MPAPPPTKVEPKSRQKDGTSSQKLMLFIRGKAMSGVPIISGTNQLPKPPIMAGMTMKNIMIRPCAVMKTFQCCPSGVPSEFRKYCTPGCCSSMRIMIDSAPPMSPAMIANVRYIVPMSLWFVE